MMWANTMYTLPQVKSFPSVHNVLNFSTVMHRHALISCSIYTTFTACNLPNFYLHRPLYTAQITFSYILQGKHFSLLDRSCTLGTDSIPSASSLHWHRTGATWNDLELTLYHYIYIYYILWFVVLVSGRTRPNVRKINSCHSLKCKCLYNLDRYLRGPLYIMQYLWALYV